MTIAGIVGIAQEPAEDDAPARPIHVALVCSCAAGANGGDGEQLIECIVVAAGSVCSPPLCTADSSAADAAPVVPGPSEVSSSVKSIAAALATALSATRQEDPGSEEGTDAREQDGRCARVEHASGRPTRGERTAVKRGPSALQKAKVWRLPRPHPPRWHPRPLSAHRAPTPRPRGPSLACPSVALRTRAAPCGRHARPRAPFPPSPTVAAESWL